MTFLDEPDKDRTKEYGIITILLLFLFPINLIFAPIFIMEWLDDRKRRNINNE